MISAGQLSELVAFERLASTGSDGSGGEVIDWAEQFQSTAHFRYLRGSEAVIAARLQGKQPVVVTIRSQPEATLITPEWRMRDLRRGTLYNIRTVVPTEGRQWFELTCESGVTV